jgi:hypothetical protein
MSNTSPHRRPSRFRRLGAPTSGDQQILVDSGRRQIAVTCAGRKQSHLRGRPEDQVSAADSLRSRRLTRQRRLHVVKHPIDIFLDGSLDEERI